MSREKLNEQAMEEAIHQVTHMLKANWMGICNMRDLQAVKHAEAGGKDGKFTYTASVRVKQKPMGDQIGVSTAISCSAKMDDECETVCVDLNGKLFEA